MVLYWAVAIKSIASLISVGIRTVLIKSHPVPFGTTPRIKSDLAVSSVSMSPLITSFNVPSPPTQTSRLALFETAFFVNETAVPGPVVKYVSKRPSRSLAIASMAGHTDSVEPFPAAGLTIKAKSEEDIITFEYCFFRSVHSLKIFFHKAFFSIT